MKREETRGSAGVNKKHVLNPEVIMSRVFGPKPKMQWTESKEELAVGRGKEKPGGKTSSKDASVLWWRKAACGVLFAVSNAIPGTSTTDGESTEGDWSICFDVSWGGGLFGPGRSKLCDEETLKHSEGIWQLHSLLDILLLNPEPRKGGGE